MEPELSVRMGEFHCLSAPMHTDALYTVGVKGSPVSLTPSPHLLYPRQLSQAWQTLNRFPSQREQEPVFHNDAHVQLSPAPPLQQYRVIA